jgi:hypothetical protein
MGVPINETLGVEPIEPTSPEPDGSRFTVV